MDDIKSLQEETSKLSVLYVEDDDSAREQIKSILEILFKKIYVGTNGAEGVEIFREHHADIDLVITDVQMPVMNGLEMSSKIKEISPNKHILILSAHNDIGYFSLAIDIGVDGFIIKPIVTEKFLKALKRSIRQIKNQKIEESYQEELKSQLATRTKELEDSLITDELTGLPNRASLNLELSGSGDFTVLLVNIDNFDHINSTYGYDIGDNFLHQISEFLSSFTTDSSTLYRLNSDEFVYLFKNSSRSEVATFAEKIIDAFSTTRFVQDKIEVALTCTIGIARGSNEQALVDAHIAMKEVREIGKNRYCFYSSNSELRSKQKNNIEWMLKVKNALDKDMVVPYFQPIINNKTKEIEKYECLARIVDSQRIITPNYFIEPARLVGMLPNITKVMIEKCFKQFAKNKYEFSLNISECDLKEGFLLDILPKMVDRYSIDPNRVVLEILENISAQGSKEALEQLKKIKDLGFKLALDDFGSEKSNFFRLQELNVDYIKIDGIFIKEIDINKNCYQITKTIKQMAKSLDAKVIAEFVHSKEVLDIIQDLEIEYSQGYYFGEPRESL